MKRVLNLRQGNTVWNFSSNEYYCDEKGNLYSSKIKLSDNGKDKDGYIFNTLMCSDKKWRPFKRHRIVFETYNGPLEEGMTINHINENKTDNSIQNLESATRKEQVNHGTRNRRTGIANGMETVLGNQKFYSKAECKRVLKIPEKKLDELLHNLKINMKIPF